MPRASRVSRVLAAADRDPALGREPVSVLTRTSKASILARKASRGALGGADARERAAVASFGRGGARGAGGSTFEAEDFGIGADVHAALTVSLPQAAQGTTERLRLPTGKELDVKIPAGITDGQQIRLKNQGMAGQGGPGDVLITVSIAPHAVFALEGTDVRLDLPVTLYEAALGAKVRVPTLDKPVELTLPPWTNSGRTFRLKGKGFPAKAGRGDLLATVRIALPDKSDPELDALMRKWQGEKPYDPRKDM
jgi:DnaJ-class molecular chaperone